MSILLDAGVIIALVPIAFKSLTITLTELTIKRQLKIEMRVINGLSDLEQSSDDPVRALELEIRNSIGRMRSR